MIGLFLEEEIPRGMTFADTVAAIRAQGGARLHPPPVRPHARDPRPGDAPPPPRRHRRLRGLQRAAAVRGVQRRGAPLRPQVQPHDGRRLGRARAPGVGTGALRMRGFEGPGGVPRSACGAPRSCAGRGRSSTSSRSSGWPRPRKGSARGRTRRPPVSAVPTDEIYEKYLQKAITEINELGDEIAQAGAGRACRCSAPATRSPTCSC